MYRAISSSRIGVKVGNHIINDNECFISGDQIDRPVGISGNNRDVIAIQVCQHSITVKFDSQISRGCRVEESWFSGCDFIERYANRRRRTAAKQQSCGCNVNRAVSCIHAAACEEQVSRDGQRISQIENSAAIPVCVSEQGEVID